MIQPVILCGGAGTRLWPESRGHRAKQFLPLAGSESLFQQTVKRTPASPAFAPPMILCGSAHVPVVRDQLGNRDALLIVEPMPRGTAGAIALAVAQADPDALLLVMPSDQVITDFPAFHAAIDRGTKLALQDWIVTFGITPDRPDTGFGYIASGKMLGESGFAVERFVEKPPLDEATRMLAAGGFSWNAGIFLFRAGRMRDAMLARCPEIFEAARDAVAAGTVDRDALHADAIEFGHAPNDSIDYAVMEKDDRVAVVPVAMGWSDLGSWHAVQLLAAKDAMGNAAVGDVFLHRSSNNLIRAGGRRVSIVGMSDVAVVVDGDDILVISLDCSQEVRAAADARKI
ncbi:mannose-1-phosphate guanylyltransferase [Sphingopyxis sp. JAI128]|uniref:mannose-1-phosphate guanylyltransferase n=1 Tax=Sphingopyxis sp. JAI128 TaxID=2723066 RepID=UPI0016221FE4|nr:sugar phosphate nucleotidyltransferase [Sphingopyxis sp. JAI128]MBB6427172.1 mannose-1-phosphate guanylyltransferase/mannose-6-phosphate isomerase [Sphingopyxis sp. JAI128]